MATMIKEKRKDKKKSTSKHTTTKHVEPNSNLEEERESTLLNVANLKREAHCSELYVEPDINVEEKGESLSVNVVNIEREDDSLRFLNIDEGRQDLNSIKTQNDIKTQEIYHSEVNELQKTNLEKSQTSAVKTNVIDNNVYENKDIVQAQLLPSAPIFHESETVFHCEINEVVREKVKPKILCMPLEEALRMFGGKEIAEVRALSEREEAIVEAGPNQDPNNPLVDLLSTFRSSLVAVERERNRISRGYIEEEKSRASLWKVEKRNVVLTERCGCGTNVSLRASYDVAELQKERLPAARLRLESLLREVQETYCHHQHSALLAYYDIEELLSETVHNSKDKIREALALIFQAMRLSDGVPDSFVEALQRWAGMLASALLETQDMGNLLFLMHYLFRQTRSVRWASSIVHLRVWDVASVAQLLALLEIMLTRPSLEEAVECVEEGEAWEEVDERGEGGAVGEGRLRERDLLALILALPLRDMVARLMMFTRQDLKQETEGSWGDKSGGRGVLRACCGTRTLLHVVQRSTHTHNTYTRLHTHMRALVVVLLNALAGLHLHSCSSYIRELEERVAAELEACFAAGFTLLGNEIYKLPATLLRDHVAVEYCAAFMEGLHDSSPHKVHSLSLEVVGFPCDVHLRVVTQAALERVLDESLATRALEFLFQTGIKPGAVPCKGGCEAVSRQLMPMLLAANPRLHTTSFCMLADIYQDAPAESMSSLLPSGWRPTPAALTSVLQQWELKCPVRIQKLLLSLDYTPHVGLSLDTQLCIGSWLCSRGEAPEWSWEVLRKLRVHRTHWGLPLDAPTYETRDLLSKAFALMAGDWGHCIPLACGPGADALLELSQSRPLDAVNCLGPVMVVMAQSPESISLTPRFVEIISALLNPGPYLMRILSRRPSPGETALQTLVMEQMENASVGWSVVSCWLHALWSPSLPGPSRVILDRGLARARGWTALDRYVRGILQLENAKEYISDALKYASAAPLLCESVLRNLHAKELASPEYRRLMDELERQRTAGEKIHVDNAVKVVGWSLPSQQLNIYLCCRGVLASVPQHPAHILLARLLLHEYLQRHRSNSPPVGTLFFSGLIHTRLHLAQAKAKLQEFVTYHHNQANALKPPETTAADSAATINRKAGTSIDNSLLPTLKIRDLVGHPSVIEERSENETEETMMKTEVNEDRDTINLISYHKAVERLCRQYVLWLEEGEMVRASPHHADIATVLSEQALDAAWRSFLKSTSISPPPSPTAQLPSQEHLTHFERVVEAIQTIENGTKDRSMMPLPQPLNESHFKNSHMLYELLDNNINELRKVTEQWCSDLSRVSSLDGQLFELVRALRAPRALPPVRQTCTNCHSSIVVTISEDEWCVSCSATQGIIENRRSFRSSLRVLARPRPSAAKAAAVLQAIARRVQSPPLALGVCSHAWAAVPTAERYGPAVDALSSLVETLVTKLVSRDISTCLHLLPTWCAGSNVQQRLCRSLVTSCSRQHCARLYRAILDLSLPPHVAFSFLSKFDLQSWADAVDSSSRLEILEAILKAAERCGPTPDSECLVLLEQLCVHSLSVVRSSELCQLVSRVMLATVHRRVSAHVCAIIPAAVQRCDDLDFDQIGNLLRDIGSMWWTPRCDVLTDQDRMTYASYSTHVADILYELIQAFVDSAVKYSYAPERVSRYGWSAMVESWSAWIAPNSMPPLLPRRTTDHGNMLTRFTDTIVMVMHRCPGSEVYFLRYVWEWSVHTYMVMEPHWPEECRLMMTSLLTSLADLPWTLNWFHVDCLPLALTVRSHPHEDILSWFYRTLQATSGDSWLTGVQPQQQHLETALDRLLQLFTMKDLLLPTECYKSVYTLPWLSLPQPSLEAALRKFFEEHHSPHTPYHNTPHFNAILSACQLSSPHSPDASCLSPRPAHIRRCLLVSEWTRAACSPTLTAHVAGHCDRLLDLISAIAPHIYQYEGEVEELLSRAIIIMCVEPAAATALPVWLSRVRSMSAPLLLSSCSAVCSLITPDYFTPLADALAKTYMELKECSGWSPLSRRWSACTWWSVESLVRGGAPYASYGGLRAGAVGLRGGLVALHAGSIHLSENEEIAALWICVAFKIIWRARVVEVEASCTDRSQEAEEIEQSIEAIEERGPEVQRADEECVVAARSLLVKWSERKRSLLQVVTRYVDRDCPTPRLQLLCRLALYVLSPSEESLSSYTSARSAVPGELSAVPDRSPRTVPLAAISLYPLKKAYFTDELDMII